MVRQNQTGERNKTTKISIDIPYNFGTLGATKRLLGINGSSDFWIPKIAASTNKPKTLWTYAIRTLYNGVVFFGA